MSLVTLINFNSIVFAYTMDDYPLNYSIETRVIPNYQPNEYHTPVKDITNDYKFILYYFDPNRVVFNITNLNTTFEMKNVYVHYRMYNTWISIKLEDIAPLDGNNGNLITVLNYPNV